MKLLYDTFLALYPLAAKLISSKNTKAKLWLQGRKDIWQHLTKAFNGNKLPVVWIHCSSLGEFEQGRPVLEQLKATYPTYKFLITFFSPSGYEVRKNYEQADWIFYLPMDSFNHAKQFFDIVQPKLILFVKYEFWHYYLHEAKQRQIPLLLISGVFRPNQIFFKWYGAFHRNMLQCFTHFFVQNDECQQLLHNIGFTKNVSISGDTRFDRVIEIAEQFQPIEAIEAFIDNKRVIVAGSTWTEDDEELDHYANTHPEIKFIIAPHEIEAERLQECLKLYKNSLLFSEWKKEFNQLNTNPTANVLIVDNVGMLSRLYRYANICYIGGAFGSDGVHNVLEAAVYYKPVIFGPEYSKYAEAIDLIDTNGALSIDNALELEKQLEHLLSNNELYKSMAAQAGNYVKSKAGATQQILHYIQEKRLLTN